MLFDVSFKNIFDESSSSARKIRTKLSQYDYIKLKSICIPEGTIRKAEASQEKAWYGNTGVRQLSKYTWKHQGCLVIDSLPFVQLLFILNYFPVNLQTYTYK